eukprot:symbB.v1.2.005395.t1/scaffold316.1/size230253/10
MTEETPNVTVPISQCSQEEAEAAEEITLRCRLGIRIVKQEVEETAESSVAQVPEAPKGDLRQFFRPQAESQTGTDEARLDQIYKEDHFV